MYTQQLDESEWDGMWFLMNGRIHPYALTWEIDPDDYCYGIRHSFVVTPAASVCCWPIGSSTPYICATCLDLHPPMEEGIVPRFNSPSCTPVGSELETCNLFSPFPLHFVHRKSINHHINLSHISITVVAWKWEKPPAVDKLSRQTSITCTSNLLHHPNLPSVCSRVFRQLHRQKIFSTSFLTY